MLLASNSGTIFLESQEQLQSKCTVKFGAYIFLYLTRKFFDFSRLISNFLSIARKLSHTSHEQSQTTVIRRNKTPPIGAGIRPFLSSLYYHSGKKLDFL